ncbi:MAG: hypothetical protein M3R57_01065, partial [Chloroflexota bacterium]|nr:hypothetical protein [Chloroflexota bacterium]
LLLLLAACGGPAAGSPAATATPASTPAETPAVTASPQATATPLVTPTPTQLAVGECTPAPPTALSVDWVEQVSLSGDYRFARPADWADLSAGLTLPSNISVSPETFAETGLAADATQKVDAVRSFDSSIVVTAWVIEGVSTRTDDLFPLELAWLKTQPQMKAVIDAQLETCIGGSKARGFSSTWTSPNGDTNFVIFMLQRNGKMYEVQLTAADPAAEVPYRELLNSWKFTEPVQGPPDLGDQFAATDFKVIGMAANLDESGDHPNVADFQSVFPQDLPRIHVIYELDDGVSDTVDFSWKRDGREIVANKFVYESTIGFAWGGLTPGSSGRFAVGSYQVTLTLESSGDTITVPFTVE